MSRPTSRPAVPVVALALHGVAHSDDLAVQSFARHLTDARTAAGSNGQSIIAGMRAFLEDRPDLMPDPPWSQPPESGDRAVRLLAAAAGCSDVEIARARTASRHDLAASAWILDPADGLDDLLDLLAGRARAIVIADRDDPATGPVLAALQLTDRVTVVVDDARPPGDVSLLLIDSTWTPRLADAHAAGHTTALVDRFGAGTGEPELRARDLAGLLPGIAGWLAAIPTAEGAHR